MYSCHSGIDESVWFRKRLGDVFWYADSPTFDKLSNFYHWFPNMPLEMTISHDAPSGAFYFYYYTRMCNISIDSKILYIMFLYAEMLIMLKRRKLPGSVHWGSMKYNVKQKSCSLF